MLFYNYQNLYFMASSDSKKIVKLLLLHQANPIKELVGTSYIRNLAPLQDPKFSYREKAEYIGLLSMRNHTDELFYRKKHMSLDDYPPWVPREVIENNPLVIVKDNQVIFPFENKD